LSRYRPFHLQQSDGDEVVTMMYLAIPLPPASIRPRAEGCFRLTYTAAVLALDDVIVLDLAGAARDQADSGRTGPRESHALGNQPSK
jgi:hypothetical protein